MRSKAINDLYVHKNKVMVVQKGERTLKALRVEDDSNDKSC